MAMTTHSTKAKKNRAASPAPDALQKEEVETEIEPTTDGALLLPWNGACNLPSGQPLGRPSTYDAATAGFKLTVDIVNDVRFRLEQYTINAGPHKGSHAFVLVPTGSFRLLDLPLEIRHMIYSFLVTRETPIMLKRYKNRLVQQNFHHGTAKSQVWDSDTKRWKNREKHLLGVSGVNKQIHREVMTELYRHKTFILADPKTFGLLARAIGVGVEDLRTVELGMGTVNQLTRALGLFKICTSLRSLRIPHSAFCTTPDIYSGRTKAIVTVDALVEACTPMLFALQKARQQTRFTQSVLDVISSIQCECSSCNAGRQDPTYAHGCYYCYCKNHAELREMNKNF